MREDLEERVINLLKQGYKAIEFKDGQDVIFQKEENGEVKQEEIWEVTRGEYKEIIQMQEDLNKQQGII